jgi:PBP1b-binding outer membrane lipoprotein LpoB
MRRTLRPLAALAMLAVIVAGCSNAPAGTGSSNSTAATHENAPLAVTEIGFNKICPR